MDKKGIEFLKDALYLLNQIPNRHIFNGTYKNTHELASAINNYLKELENDTRKN